MTFRVLCRRRSIRTLLTCLVCVLLAGLSSANGQTPRNIVYEDVSSVYHMENVGKDIYAFISPEPKVPIVSGNCVAIIGANAILVVDSGEFPALTRRMIADIQRKSNKPVRYLVITHWHSDHNTGNAIYAAEFPGISIISTTFTRQAMNEYGPKTLEMQQKIYPRAMERYKKALDAGTNFDGTRMTENDKRYTSGVIEVMGELIPQLQGIDYVGPNVTFTDQITVDLGGRDVKIFWPGNANTAGDAVVYVPDQKLLVTGDILVWPTPYATTSYIGSWVNVLDKLLAMDVSTIVPGHGPVMRDKSYMQTVRRLLAELNDQTKQAVAQGLSLEDTKKKVTMQSYKDELTQGIPARVYAWDNYFMTAVDSAWQEQKGIPIDENPFPPPGKK
ncbi:MAG TPA: MBL fold metallo-hydrolase [Terriglobales bacterium]|nr:MBL fold metallo-hydrolase [Terriglobales bacterium]